MNEKDLLALGRIDLTAYAAAVYSGFELPPHLERLANRLEAIERGESLRLVVEIPPRHGKSVLASTIFPAWALGRDPRRSIIFAGYSAEFAEGFGRRVRNIIAGSMHGMIFPGSKLSADSTAAGRFDLTAGGSFVAAGAGGPLTGRGADILILDDVVKNDEEARSETARRALKEWFSLTAFTRLAPGGACIVVGSRWHRDDLIGYLLAEHGREWEELRIPAIAERGDVLGRVEGEALWPSRYPLVELQKKREQIGMRGFNSLYQADPSPEEGSIFKREWFGTFDQRPALGRVIQSWDTAYGKNKSGDYSACATIGESETGYEILHVYRDRPDFPTLKKKMAVLAEEWPVSAVLVEDAASGASIIQEMRAESRTPVIAVPATSDKVSRWNAVAPLFEAGKVRFQAGAAWLPDVLEELASVPAAKHDDVADAIAQGLAYLRTSAGNWGDPKAWAAMIERADRKLLGLPDVGPDTADEHGVYVVETPEEGSWKW
jgi:predicted phage terminase large subunit-like protein